MAKLVRRGGKLLRIGGKLVRSAIDLDPDSPCECCEEPPPPDPGTWFCVGVVGNGGQYLTRAACLAACENPFI